VANLNDEAPLVYVVLREGGEHGQPVHVAIVTASPHEAEAYGQVSEEIVGGVAMPQPLVELVEAFVAEHHAEEPFVKRQRQKHHQAEEHKFGQEPIEVLRKRQPGAGENE
jgi:hypothetical protein